MAREAGPQGPRESAEVEGKTDKAIEIGQDRGTG